MGKCLRGPKPYFGTFGENWTKLLTVRSTGVNEIGVAIIEGFIEYRIIGVITYRDLCLWLKV